MTRRGARRPVFLFALMLAGACAPLAHATPGAADSNIIGNPEQIGSILRAAEYPVELKSDKEGLPYIQSSKDERSFRIYFYDCDEGIRLERCLSVQFYAAFTIGRPFPADRMNEWNRTRRFARGYIDHEQDPTIEMDVNLAADGMPSRLFKDTLDLWTEVFRSFDDFVFDTPDPNKEAAPPAPDEKQ